MKKALVVTCLAVMIAATGCIHTIKAPLTAQKDIRYNLTPADFQILGTVSAEGSIRNICFIYSWGGDGFAALEEKAKAMGGDDIVNYTFDVESFGIIFFVYNKWTWRARGTVIKYRDTVKK